MPIPDDEIPKIIEELKAKIVVEEEKFKREVSNVNSFYTLKEILLRIRSLQFKLNELQQKE